MTTRSGWHALPDDLDAPPNTWAVHDGLFVGGRCVAKVEAFHDGGPFYANAITPAGEHVRGGAAETQAFAMDWCERMAGVRPVTSDSEGGERS